MTLGTVYTRYLQQRTDPLRQAATHEALVQAGYGLEAQLLDWYIRHGAGYYQTNRPASIWDRQRIWVGDTLPGDVTAGDLWFDTCELMPMMAIPRDPADLQGLKPEMLRKLTPCHSWLALRPVAVWQFTAFVELATSMAHPTQVAPPFMLLARDRFAGDDRAAVVNVTQGEAAMYALWFGKGVADLDAWRLTAQLLAPDVREALLHTLKQEWVRDRVSSDEGARIVAAPNTFEDDPDEVYEAAIDQDTLSNHPMIRGEWHYSPDVGFRTAVPMQTGLIALSGAGFVVDNLRLQDQLQR